MVHIAATAYPVDLEIEHLPRVLVAEPDVDCASGISLMLGSIAEVLVQPTGHHLIESYEWDSPDVLVIEYELPDMDGVELLERLRTNFDTEAPAILMSANDGCRELSLAAGFHSFLQKPFGTLDLIWVIERARIKRRP